MNKLQKAGIILIFLFVAGMVWLLTMDACESVAYAEDSNHVEEQVYEAVKQLQPAHDDAVAASWASILYTAGLENELDPLLVTTIAFRESSLLATVADGRRGELGVMQVHGVARRHRPHGCMVREIGCNIRTGSAFLAWVRDHCGGPWDVWVGGYGMSRCPTAEEARELRSVRRARRIYESIGGTQWR